jgi:oligoribonuclease (3'-5' exoribonuclease)
MMMDEMTYSEARKILRGAGIDCRFDEILDIAAAVTRKNQTIQELREQNADLLAALRLCLPVMEAHCEASHLTDGFRPRINKNDHILSKIKAAIERGEKPHE